VATKPGRTFPIDGGLLAQQLGKIPAGEVYFFETKRRERLKDQPAEISRDPAQRGIVIPAAPNVAYRELSGLPSTIRIGPGKLETTASTRRTCSTAHGTRAGHWRYAGVGDRKQEAI
jgi:hypothetical protein